MLRFRKFTITSIVCLCIVFVSMMVGILSIASVGETSGIYPSSSSVLGGILFTCLIQITSYVICLVAAIKYNRIMLISGFAGSLLTAIPGYISIYSNYENFVESSLLGTVASVFFTMALISNIVTAIACFCSMGKYSTKLFSLTTTIINIIFISCFVGATAICLFTFVGNEAINLPYQAISFIVYAASFLLCVIISAVSSMLFSLREIESKSVAQSNSAFPRNQEEIVNQLKHYKKMLDEGLISQEDFDKKKADLLGK